ncbi:hypothetical protein PINS_up021254 [Pythium insidiosum]|nr:hypothetical protein PINS_up021254 [Pythium insidiosum]
MSSAVTLPIKFLADDAPSVVATVGSTERTLQLDIVCSNVLVRCVDDAKCPKPSGPKSELIHYSSYHKFNSVRVEPVNNTIVSTKEFSTTKNFRVGQVGVSDNYWEIPTRADGVLGLGPDTRDFDSDIYNKLRMSGSTSDSVFSSQLSSFSLSLGATPADGGSVILNGADDDRITKEKLTGYKVALDSDNGYDLRPSSVLLNGVEAASDDMDPYQLDSTIDEVHLPSKAWYKLLDDLSCTATYKNFKYDCDSSKPFPPIGLTFGDSTFYLTKEYYTTPHPTQAGRVVLKVDSSTRVARLGLPFLRAFPVQIIPGSSVTVYCKEGKSCAKGVIPKSPPTSAPPRRTAATHAPSEGVNTDNGDSADNSATLASTMHNVGFAHAIVSTIILVLLIIAGIVRKQRNASKAAVNAASAESNAANPAIVLTPQASSTTFIDAKTPKP